MEKVDIIIGVVGIVALIATGLGVAFYDDINAIEDWQIQETEHEVTAGPESAEDGLERQFTFTTPQNATGASFEVTVTAESQNPAQQGDVTVQLTLTGPDGSEVTETFSFPFSDGSATFTIEALDWAETPDDFSGNEDDLATYTTEWDEDIVLDVVVDGPGTTDPLPLPGVPGPTYTAEVAGTIHAYQAVLDLPDSEVA